MMKIKLDIGERRRRFVPLAGHSKVRFDTHKLWDRT